MTFRGTGYGADGETFGEMVFNTGMTGYQETLTDPSYCGQIVAMTAPHIGNTGVNDADPESRRIWVSGYVIREPARIFSSWRAERGLSDELRDQGITGIAITGTRALTRHLRERGAMRAAISTREPDPARLLERVLASPPMAGADLAGEVSTARPYVVGPPAGALVRYRVAAVDLGIKAATPRSLARLGCQVTVLPAASTAGQILASGPDGVFFSNGPGDPAAVGYAVEAMRGVLGPGLRCSGSAWAARSWAGRSAWTPTSCASGTAASISRCRTCGPGACRSPATTTGSRSRCRARLTRPRRGRGRGGGLAGGEPHPRACAVRHRLRPGRRHPRQPQRRRRRGAPAAGRAGVQRPVPPRGRPGPARRGGPVRRVLRADGALPVRPGHPGPRPHGPARAHGATYVAHGSGGTRVAGEGGRPGREGGGRRAEAG